MNLDACATELVEALVHARSIATFSSRDPSFNMAQAYAIAERVHRARMARGEQPAGRKIGFTNRNIWAEYGVYEPIWGHVYDTTVTYAQAGRAELSLGSFVEPRLEPEVVLHFKSRPRVTAHTWDLEAAILESIDWIAHGFEVVQSPFPSWKFKVEDTVAAGGVHAALVVGTPVPVSDIPECARKLREFRLSLFRDDVGTGSRHRLVDPATEPVAPRQLVQAEGTGANVLGSPLLAFAHLAQVLERLPQFAPVGEGEVVTTGTLTAAMPVKPGESWSTTLTGIELPGLAITFS